MIFAPRRSEIQRTRDVGFTRSTRRMRCPVQAGGRDGLGYRPLVVPLYGPPTGLPAAGQATTGGLGELIENITAYGHGKVADGSEPVRTSSSARGSLPTRSAP